ncbi:mitochondrial sodium/calcium exchanger protein-like [Scaptodrosophila lebanonensis]|uniref:Mitochondrial sodium/calcium exchanger protein-like n=1 Tax=Drosophila lebanonensis TaxID=7225 RepID=A0A6J2UI49_DROLE|nr:mitochondrial sodium/calcium exchanger protein-like [Scaptodrosophila lebanonensis]
MDEYEPNEIDEEFATYADEVSCNNVLSFPYEDRCEFVNNTPDCVEEMHLLTYMSLMSCQIRVKNKFEECVFITFCLALCAFMLLMLAYTADIYFSPALRTISRYLHMNEHLAGVTILAFGNTSPDVFANLAEVKGSKAVFANSMASSIFVTMLTGGVVCFLSPFRMNAHATIRDILFIMLGVLVMDYILKSGEGVEISEVIVMGVLYLAYLVVNMLDLYMMRRTIKALEAELQKMVGQPMTPETRRKKKMYENKLNEMKNDADIDVKTEVNEGRSSTRSSIDPESTRNRKFDPSHPKNDNLLKEALEALKPIDFDEWKSNGVFWRSFLLAKAPIVVMCGLFIPLVDQEADKHGWCKLLNCMQVFTTPVVIVLIGMGYIDRSRTVWHLEVQFEYVPYLLLLAPLSIAMFLHSRTDIPPSYHWVFTYVSVLASMFVLYVTATEIDKIFDLIGTVLDISEHFMGATVNCACGALGDLVTNAALAMQGYEKMAYAATMGGPFFNLLIGTGATFVGRIYYGLHINWHTQLGEYGPNSFVFLLVGLSTTLLWSSVLNFRARRSVGIFNICIYLLYVLFNVLAENDIMHSYANDEFLELA